MVKMLWKEGMVRIVFHSKLKGLGGRGMYEYLLIVTSAAWMRLVLHKTPHAQRPEIKI